MRAWRQPSLTLRSTLAFSVVAMLAVASTSMYLYQSMKASVLARSDQAVLARLDHFRKLLQYDLSLDTLRGSPQLFENMLGSEGDIFIIAEPGEAPIININPLQAMLPPMPVAQPDQPLTRSLLRSGTVGAGIPLRAAVVTAISGDKVVHLTAAHLAIREMAALDSLRRRIAWSVLAAFSLTAALGYLLLRRGLRPLRRMADHAANITPARLDSRMGGADTPVELQQLEDAYNGMLDRLADGYQRLTQFSADLAHEIRTPLGSLMGACQVALRRSRTADEYQQLLVSNLEELERISRLVESILFLARADDAQTALNRQPVSAALEIQRVAGYFEGLAEERQLTLSAQGDCQLHADPLLLRRALSNLVANAIRYADESSCIEIRALSDGEHCRFEVENQGPPLSEAVLSKMFDRFYRGDASRQQASDSNGLGLAIVTAIMHWHGGKATVDVSRPQRVCFALVFPAVQGEGR